MKYNSYINENIKDKNNLSSKSKKKTNKKININLKAFPYRDINNIFYSCSKDCAINLKNNCNKCPKDYDYNGTCHNFITDNYENYYSNKGYYCYVQNLIIKWKSHLYKKENCFQKDEISYIKNAILPNETCPNNTRFCGILDDEGHKLCLPNEKNCHINKIVINNTIDDDLTKNKSIILDNLTLYYSNEENTNGRIVEGLYVDSSRSEIYKGCEIIDTTPLLDLIEDHGKRLYTDETTPIESNEIAYLKWCPYKPSEKVNLIKMKELYDIYVKNSTINIYVIRPIENDDNLNKLILIIIIIESVIFVMILILGFIWKKKNKGSFLESKKSFKITLIFFGYFDFLILDFGFLSLFKDGELNKIFQDKEKYNIVYDKIDRVPSIITLNKVIFSLCFIYSGLNLLFFIFVIKVRYCEKDVNDRNNRNDNIDNLIPLNPTQTPTPNPTPTPTNN